MNPLPPALNYLLGIFVALVVPAALLLTAVRVLATPLFLQIEYRTPNFPPDEYGFTQADRLQYAPIALQYLFNEEDISFLGDLTFEDGTPLYNQRELGHMQDVKALVQPGLWIWYGTLAFLLLLGVWAWRAGWWPQYRVMLAGGGKLTILFIVALLLYIGINFNQVFTNFHRIFFEGDTWLFLFSDTLIRLFPIRFWRDVFVFVGILTLSSALAVWYFFGLRAAR